MQHHFSYNRKVKSLTDGQTQIMIVNVYAEERMATFTSRKSIIKSPQQLPVPTRAQVLPDLMWSKLSDCLNLKHDYESGYNENLFIKLN